VAYAGWEEKTAVGANFRFVSGPAVANAPAQAVRFTVKTVRWPTGTVQVLNFTNAINFTPQFNPGAGATIFQVTSAYQDISGNYDPGGRLGCVPSPTQVPRIRSG